jgi:hypothetical protein
MKVEFRSYKYPEQVGWIGCFVVDNYKSTEVYFLDLDWNLVRC